jgi:hypothetical protein
MLIPYNQGKGMRGTIGLMGYLADPVTTPDPNITALQNSLNNLGIKTMHPEVHCTPTGVVDDQTVAAVVAGLGLLSDQLPTWAYLSIQAALTLGSATDEAKSIVKDYAPQLTIAANTAAAKFGVPGMMARPTPWYMTPLGLLVILGSAYVLYKYVLSPTPAAPAKAA